MINPILEREMRARFRGKKSFLLLTLFVLLEIGIFVLIFVSIAFSDVAYPWTATTQALGRRVFDAFAAVLVLLVGMFTPASAASVIAAEREKRTLEFLELTLLTPLEIVTGKLAVALLYVAVLGVTALPVVSLVFVLGGVSPQHVVALYAVLATLALALGAIGVWTSAWSKTTVSATVATYGLAALMSPFWAAMLDRPLSHGGSSWAKLLQPEVPWFGWHLRPLSLVVVPVVLVAHVLIQNAAAKMGNRDTYRPLGERVSVWMAFTGMLVLAAGLMEGAKQSIAGKGIPYFLVLEGFLLLIVLAMSSLAHETRSEAEAGALGALALVARPGSILRARVLGEPRFVLLLCLSAAAVHGLCAPAAGRSPVFGYEVVAFHLVMTCLAVPLSLVLAAMVSIWERWMPDLPRGFRVAFAGALLWSLFAAEYLHYSVMRRDSANEELSAPAIALAYLSPFKALSTMDLTLQGGVRPHRDFPGYAWSELANFPGKHRPGWMGTLVLYGGMGLMGAAGIALAHWRRRKGAS